MQAIASAASGDACPRAWGYPGTYPGGMSRGGVAIAAALLFLLLPAAPAHAEDSEICRLSDKMRMNHGNTFCVSGASGVDLQVEEIFEKLCEKLCSSSATSSHELELECKASTNPDFGALNVKFKTSFKTRTSRSSA